MGSSAEGARLVVFWGEQRNWGGGAAALRAERAGGRGMNHTHACRRIHTIKPTVRTVTVERRRVACLRLRASVTRLCEVAAQGGSPTACFSCRGNKPGASSRSKPRAHGGDRTASCCASTRSPSRTRGASPFHKMGDSATVQAARSSNHWRSLTPYCSSMWLSLTNAGVRGPWACR